MIRYLYADQLSQFPRLGRTMFEDRADQFRTRLGWDVTVNDAGQERDEYDDLNPLYVIWEKADGSHGGSMRFLPTTGRTMVNEHFLDLTHGVPFQSPLIWECTRFCLSRNTEPGTAAALMLAGGEIMQGFGVRHFVGVFDARMVRIYNRIGAAPEVLGTQGEGRQSVGVGLWEFSEAAQKQVSRVAGVPLDASRAWFDAAFGDVVPQPCMTAA
ncbi:acyl-homoserine-lactone synthase [Marivita geojedonensis]|uniref:Acyl-homoserine-lactone synthase n=1 Tax=Marivita geojedonensis TaxID=1123756 RepID=A0A1X4NPZ5_9RHOB|nr:acyl-homoserine-lactone synthase [Marivita geojedonensis]OSQ53024.1 autoinducer synthase [Marivita geojedonensis]PRY82066.1 acyl homoserine lactone synthase [Marivita geojedonensis]